MKSFAQGVRWKCGAYRYRVPRWVEQSTVDSVFNGKREYKLGKTQYEAAVEYARVMRELEGPVSTIVTMGDLMTRYRSEVVPLKHPKTKTSNIISLNRLYSVFANIQPINFETTFVFQYRDKLKDTRTSANRDLEVLSHLFSKAIEWGVIKNEAHPMRGLNYKYSNPPRDRYVSDTEVEEALKVASPFLYAYIQLKLSLGLRKGDMLRIKLSDLTPEGIQATNTKTGKKTLYTLTPERKTAWDLCLKARPRRRTHFNLLFCTRDGKPYIDEQGTTSGFDSVWQRFMKKALAETNLEERFTEHDLRAKVASDSKDSEQARKRMGHTSSAVTERVYRRKAERAD
jgi:integrase